MKVSVNILYRNLFIISLLWLLFEGVFRKWMFFEIAGPLFYVKYILFGLTYTSFLTSTYRLPTIKKGYQFFILIFIFLCILGLLNNKLNNSMIVGIIGLIVHLFFIPMIHINQFIFKSLNSIFKLLNILTYISIPICILGMIQFYLPVDHELNAFANEDQLISRVHEFTRISSIFSFVKIYNAYLLFNITFITVGILNKMIKNERVLISIIALILLMINMFMTGSRLPIGLMLINFIIIGVYVFISFSTLRKTISVVSLFSVLTVTSLYFTTDYVKDPINASIYRFEKAEARYKSESTGYTDIQARVEDRLDIFKFSQEAGWFGYGIGMTYQGARNFIKNPIPFYFEEEGERIVLELGIIGGIFVILFRLSIFFFAFGVLKACNSVEIKLFLLGLILYIAPAVLTIQMTTYSYMENFFYYFALGLIFALLKIYQTKRVTSQ